MSFVGFVDRDCIFCLSHANAFQQKMHTTMGFDATLLSHNIKPQL
jgi:hypothetical protein